MADTGEAQEQAAREQEARDTGSIMNFMSARKIGTASWVLRWYLLFLSIYFMFFCSAFEMSQYFQRALLANGIICALRLHQRVPEFRLSRAHFALLMTEDSAHYLLFSLTFLSSHPITIALMPVSVFALLHGCNFTRQMLDVKGPNSYPTVRTLINHVARHQATLFRFIAMNEIMIMPTTIFMAFTGRAPIFVPFLYYKFIRMRYVSKRNPYNSPSVIVVMASVYALVCIYSLNGLRLYSFLQPGIRLQMFLRHTVTPVSTRGLEPGKSTLYAMLLEVFIALPVATSLRRILFYELRLAAQACEASENCPAPLKFLIMKLVGLCSRLSPPPSAYPPAQ